ncbi:electron transfer flavoprotein subunit alpha/FixB family protein [Dactylosporangium sp. CA-139114]|uniref:electron transfer flavoprotein subunit alpha/FixB family protein n=1 Tax=Dactylosporangium sp. CA-139114 TaxID=3239931 RepID=UPI003D96930A
MNDILVLAEHARGVVSDVTRQAVTAGRELKQNDQRLVVVVIAASPDALTDAVALEGVDEVLAVQAGLAEFNADVVAAALRNVIAERRPAAVLAGHTANVMSVAPRVALTEGLGLASDVMACEFDGDRLVARRLFYGGKVEAELEFPAGSAFLLLRPTVWQPSGPADTQPPVARMSAPDTASRIENVELVNPPAGDFDITKAEIVLALGRGVGEKENIARFEALADKMGVTLAASRPLIDAGWMPKFRQVGQSGVSVKPRLYLAFGISGAVQHIAGIKGSEKIVAVNKDPQAPIFEVADLGSIADIFEVAEELEALW